MKGVNIHRGRGIIASAMHHWSSGILTSGGFAYAGLNPWTRLYSLNRSLESWEDRFKDYRTQEISFPSIIGKMLDAKMVTATEAENLYAMGKSENREDWTVLIIVLKQIYKTKKHVHRQGKTLRETKIENVLD